MRTYNDAIAGACGQIDVVRVARDAAITTLDVTGHIVPNAVDTLTRRVCA